MYAKQNSVTKIIETKFAAYKILKVEKITLKPMTENTQGRNSPEEEKQRKRIKTRARNRHIKYL